MKRMPYKLMENIILVDFAGTLIKAEIIEEANILRSQVLKKVLPSKQEHANPETLYKANREFVEKVTGITKGMKIECTQNDLTKITIPGEAYQNQMATNLFQLGMYLAAKKYKKDIIPGGFTEQLQKAKSKGYKLAIASGVRTDIISGMLQIAGITDLFDYIYGQPPILGVDNQANLNNVAKHGRIAFVIGDKMSDLEVANTKTIFVTWGHASGGEQEFADYTINDPKELESIL